jgi:hypothetical protein
MPLPKAFQTFAEFEREVLRPNNRIGLTLEDMVEDQSFDAELDFDKDPFDREDEDDDD